MLREHLSALFKELNVNAYYFYAEDNAKFPYIVYDLRHMGSLSDDEQTKRYVMEINAYTKSGIGELDDLLDRLEAGLSNYRRNTPEFFVWINLAYGRIDIEETRPLKRKRVNFEIHYYLGG
jgi:hypothetical protein